MARPGPTHGTRLRLPTAARAGALQQEGLAARTGLNHGPRLLLLPIGAGAAGQQQRGHTAREMEGCPQGLKQGGWPEAVYHEMCLAMRRTCMAFQAMLL